MEERNIHLQTLNRHLSNELNNSASELAETLSKENTDLFPYQNVTELLDSINNEKQFLQKRCDDLLLRYQNQVMEDEKKFQLITKNLSDKQQKIISLEAELLKIKGDNKRIANENNRNLDILKYKNICQFVEKEVKNKYFTEEDFLKFVSESNNLRADHSFCDFIDQFKSVIVSVIFIQIEIEKEELKSENYMLHEEINRLNVIFIQLEIEKEELKSENCILHEEINRIKSNQFVQMEQIDKHQPEIVADPKKVFTLYIKCVSLSDDIPSNAIYMICVKFEGCDPIFSQFFVLKRQKDVYISISSNYSKCCIDLLSVQEKTKLFASSGHISLNDNLGDSLIRLFDPYSKDKVVLASVQTCIE
ncbi:hypothetical protein O9G_005184 [Rozella allomycis CSF55]|uniref:Uncharacterized protein n=1 Tax=Rozella allomycis (strain CSF55) TaxID=988480 RepID=A0A075AMX1_ROZAC|nr:hypothetical protein O9G_005184 [Rozella allomycis CSF55]|eukprot:EPZ31048.1 hypothetical protein O9G_005184 [Rozella allomycis CSF55]